jgi:ribosome-associated protein
LDEQAIIKELQFKALRSSGAGGQHVNKVSSKVELSFNISASKVLADHQKSVLIKTLASRLTKENVLLLSCDETRSQHNNKKIVIERFLEIINKGLILPKKRKTTKTPKSSIKKRLELKKKRSVKKINRKKPDLET